MDLSSVSSSYLHYGDVHNVYRSEQRLGGTRFSRRRRRHGMSRWHHRPVWWSGLASLLAVVALGLGLATVPASGSPSLPMLPRDPAAMVGQVGPQIVYINTKFGYNNAIGAGSGIVIDPGGVVL